jgi:hypothetical protein
LPCSDNRMPYVKELNLTIEDKISWYKKNLQHL